MRAGPALALSAALLVACQGGADGEASRSSSTSTIAAAFELRPADPSVVGLCEAAAGFHDHAVACPTMLPFSSRFDCERPGQPLPAPCVFEDAFILSPIVGGIPPGFVDDADGPLHVVIGTQAGPIGCTEEASVRTDTTVRSADASLFECSDLEGLHAGHSMLTWEEDNVHVFVSVHGHTTRRVALARELAASVELIEPAP